MARMFLSSRVLQPPGRRANSIMLLSVVNRALRRSGVRFFLELRRLRVRNWGYVTHLIKRLLTAAGNVAVSCDGFYPLGHLCPNS